MEQVEPGGAQGERRRKLWGWIFGGCGAVLVIMVSVVILFVAHLARRSAELKPVIENFLSLVEGREYDRAYRSIGDDWKQQDSFEEFLDLVVLVEDALGPHQSVRLTGVHFQKNIGSSARANAEFTGQFQKARATIRVILQQYDGVWKIEGIHFNSEAIQAKLTCPHCGTVNTLNARHCSTCGAKIARPSDQVTEKQLDAI